MILKAGRPGEDIAEDRILASYLYCGVGAIAAEPDARGALAALKRRIDEGELLGPEIFPAPQAGVFSLTAFQVAAGDASILSGDLAQQFYPAGWLHRLAALASQRAKQPDAFRAAQQQLEAMWRNGELPAPAGAAAGWLGVHGPALVHELTLWVESGVPAAAALQAATGRAAARLGARGRLGCVHEGCEATLLLVDGNPLDDIAALRRIHSVFARGERIARGELASQNKNEDK